MTPEAFGQVIDHGSPRLAAGFVLAAMVAGGWLTRQDARSWPLSRWQRTGVIAAVMLTGLACCAIPAFFAGDVIGSYALMEWRGPKTILGGLLGGFAGAAVFKMLSGIRFDTSDAFARGTCLMLAIGRLGCAARHCCFGIEGPGWDLGDGVTRVPVPFIEAAAVFALFCLLQVLHSRNLFQNRRLFVFFLGYGLIRFGCEFLREQVAGGWLGIGFYQWLALLLAGVGAFQIVKRSPRLATVAACEGTAA